MAFGVDSRLSFLGPAPKKRSLESTPNATAPSTSASASSNGSAGSATSGDLSGTWQPTSDSQVGYRVNEVLFGQKNTAVGRTNKVTGTMVIDGTTVKAVDLKVDMATVTSDESRRDNQFRGRVMDVSSFPTATFKLTKPIALASVPADGSTVSATATGDLTLHGTTKPVTVDLKAKRTGNTGCSRSRPAPTPGPPGPGP